MANQLSGDGLLGSAMAGRKWTPAEPLRRSPVRWQTKMPTEDEKEESTSEKIEST